MKDSTEVEVMVSEQEKHGCESLFRGWKRMIQELDLQDRIHLGLDEYDEKCRRKKQELLMWVTADLRSIIEVCWIQKSTILSSYELSRLQPSHLKEWIPQKL